MDYVLPMLESQMPVDVLVIMLGGIDLKRKFHLPAPDVAGSLQNMLLRVRSHLRVYLNSPQTRILVVAPVPIGEGIAKSRFAPFFDAEDALRQSRELARWYRLVAEQFGCAFQEYVGVRGFECAKECLSRDPQGMKKSIQEIALQCGFTNDVTFRRTFKRYTGVTPSQFCKDEE